MPSPPLAPDDGPIDFEHLSRMTLGDAGLKQEVLAMFVAQSTTLVSTLAAMPADASALAHTLKGSARAIGDSIPEICVSLTTYGTELLTMIKNVLIAAISFVSVNQ